MAQKRRGILALVAGVGIAAVKGADEAAVFLARGSDEVIEGAGKGSDEAGSKTDDLVTGAKRVHRRQRIESLLRDKRAAESFTVPGGYYAGFRIEPGYRARLSYEFETEFGRSIDVFLFRGSELRSYETDGEALPFESAHFFERASGERTVELDRDAEYYLIFDNTDAGVATATEFDVTVTTDVRLAVL